jgi:hypothetical protein
MKSRLIDGLVCLAVLAAVILAGLSYFRPITSTSNGQQELLASVNSLVGTKLASVRILGSKGALETYVPPSHSSVYLLFSSTCVVCEQNASRWKGVVDGLDSAIYVAVVSMEGVDVAHEWLDRHGIRADTILLPAQPSDFAAKWHARAVPLTLLTDSTGDVSFAHLGILGSAELAALDALLGRTHAVGLTP